MRRIAVVLLVLLPPPASGQLNPYAPQQPDPRIRRAWREQAVAWAGGKARELVEKEGDDGVRAILYCSPSGARKLTEWYASGGLSKLPYPQWLLQAIGQPGHGDDVVLWAIEHAGELADPFALEAYCASPLDYALNLRSLEQGAAEVRARRLATQAAVAPQSWQVTLDGQKLLVLGGAAAGVGLLVWMKRRQRGGISV